MTPPKSTRSRPKRPQTPGAKFRAAMLGLYQLNPAEIALLDRAAALVDVLARLEDEIAAERSLTTSGSQRQTVAAPLLAAHRAGAKVLAGLLDQLQIPSPEETEGHLSSVGRARRAALARWSKEVG